MEETTISTTSIVFSPSMLRHHPGKLFVVEFSVAVRVGLPHESVNLLIGQSLAQGGCHPAEFLHLNVAILVLVKDPEG